MEILQQYQQQPGRAKLRGKPLEDLFELSCFNLDLLPSAHNLLLEEGKFSSAENNARAEIVRALELGDLAALSPQECESKVKAVVSALSKWVEKTKSRQVSRVFAVCAFELYSLLLERYLDVVEVFEEKYREVCKLVDKIEVSAEEHDVLLQRDDMTRCLNNLQAMKEFVLNKQEEQDVLLPVVLQCLRRIFVHMQLVLFGPARLDSSKITASSLERLRKKHKVEEEVSSNGSSSSSSSSSSEEEGEEEEKPIVTRKRLPWTDEEDDELRKGVKKYGKKWAQIFNDPKLTFAEGRGSVALKDRWRVIGKE